MVESRIEFEVESIIEGKEWLVSYREDGGFVYVVSICADDIDWENRAVKYIHIENIDYLYSIVGEAGIDEAYDMFENIEKEVLSHII